MKRSWAAKSLCFDLSRRYLPARPLPLGVLLRMTAHIGSISAMSGLLAMAASKRYLRPGMQTAWLRFKALSEAATTSSAVIHKMAGSWERLKPSNSVVSWNPV